MKKASFNKKVFGRQATILALTLSLSLAIYLNWRINAGEKIALTGLSIDAEQQENSDARYYGDAQYVSSGNSADDYFTQARLERSQSRGAALDQLSETLSESDLTEAEKQQTTEKLAMLSRYTAAESSIENLIIAKGFEECVCFISDNAVKVVVKSAGLSEQDVAKITEIIVSEASVPASCITIVEVE